MRTLAGGSAAAISPTPVVRTEVLLARDALGLLDGNVETLSRLVAAYLAAPNGTEEVLVEKVARGIRALASDGTLRGPRCGWHSFALMCRSIAQAHVAKHRTRNTIQQALNALEQEG